MAEHFPCTDDGRGRLKCVLRLPITKLYQQIRRFVIAYQDNRMKLQTWKCEKTYRMRLGQPKCFHSECA